MGMDLKPVEPTDDAPRYPSNDEFDPDGLIWGRYNWGGWSRQMELLEAWGWTAEQMQWFAWSNDGAEIPAETCVAVADAIEQHANELKESERAWLLTKVKLWRTCGGYRQF